MGTSFSAWFWPVLCRHLAPPRAAACSPFPGFAFCILHSTPSIASALGSCRRPPLAAPFSSFAFCPTSAPAWRPAVARRTTLGRSRMQNAKPENVKSVERAVARRTTLGRSRMQNAKCKTGKCKARPPPEDRGALVAATSKAPRYRGRCAGRNPATAGSARSRPGWPRAVTMTNTAPTMIASKITATPIIT
jgi:hypothetical protein